MDIKPVRNQFYDCLSANLITIASYKKKDYYMWFSNRLNFGYLQQEEVWNILRDYHGITKYEGKFSSASDFISYIKEELSQDNPIMLATDIYNCPWNVYYKKRHNFHYILIIDYTKDAFICLDPFFSSLPQKFFFHELDTNIKCIVLKFGPQHESLYESLFYLIYFLSLYANKMIVGDLDTNLVFKVFSNTERIENEYDTYGMYGIPAVKLLASLDNNRECFIEMLKQIQTLFRININEFIDRINNISLRLRILRIKILRAALDKNKWDIVNDNYAVFDDITQNEKMLVLEFLIYIKNIITKVHKNEIY